MLMVAPTSKNRYIAPDRGAGGRGGYTGGRGGGGRGGGGRGGGFGERGGGGRGGRGGGGVGRREGGGLYKRGPDGRQQGGSGIQKKPQPAKVLKPRLDKNGKPIKESVKWGLDRVAFHLYKQSGSIDDKTSLIPKTFRKPKNADDQPKAGDIHTKEGPETGSDGDDASALAAARTFGRPDGKPVTLADIAERTKIDPVDAQFLNLANMRLGKLPDLASCARLTRLDAAGNGLTSLDPVAACRDLTWLSVKDNQIKDLSPIKRHFGLEVLTLSMNQVHKHIHTSISAHTGTRVHTQRMHTNTHTSTRARTHTHTHTYTHARTHARTHTLAAYLNKSK